LEENVVQENNRRLMANTLISDLTGELKQKIALHQKQITDIEASIEGKDFEMTFHSEKIVKLTKEISQEQEKNMLLPLN
jgi:hypothetical protein